MKLDLIPIEDGDRYAVTLQHEIERILSGVHEARGQVAIYSENGKDRVLSRLLAVEPDSGRILLKLGADGAVNARLCASTRVTCVTRYEHVHIQFTCSWIAMATDSDLPAFSASLPTELLRVQRRDSYRLPASALHPIKCLIKTPAGLVESMVEDISVGGVGVLAFQEDGALQPGETYHGCHITLPETGEFALSLNVRTVFDIRDQDGQFSHRAGCQFINLPPSVETLIQRYIFREDRERRARYT